MVVAALLAELGIKVTPTGDITTIRVMEQINLAADDIHTGVPVDPCKYNMLVEEMDLYRDTGMFNLDGLLKSLPS
jgi:hypothetical protein